MSANQIGEENKIDFKDGKSIQKEIDSPLEQVSQVLCHILTFVYLFQLLLIYING